MMKVRMIEQRDNGVCLFELKNDEIKVITSNLGCHVLSVFTKDREGNFGDVVLGFENVEAQLLSDEILERKEEILSAKLHEVGGATC